MQVYSSVAALRAFRDAGRKVGRSVGLVPTMGALHAGHISLVKRCRAENDIVVTSVFVNPTQFNDPADLEKYPRTLDHDVAMLREAGCDAVFAPSVEEMYPQQDTRQFHFGPLEQVMEGVRRPGHFNGVAQIVTKLFDIVCPDRAYFGEKDFQQLAIIRQMVKDQHYPIQIVPCPIVREADGLAMSSRNTLLSADQRREVPLIAQTLFASRDMASKMTVRELRDWVIGRINASPAMQVEYFEIVDRDTLQPVGDWTARPLQGCIAVQVGTIRLIDNIAY